MATPHKINTVRSFIGISLLVFLTLPFVGTYIWLQQERAEVKRTVSEKIEEGLEPKELVTLKFSEEELSELLWEHEREFEYNGQMYDVVEKRIQGDTIVYICWWDHEETRLKEEMKKLLAGKGQDVPFRNDQQQRIDTFGKNLFFHTDFFYDKKKEDKCLKGVFPSFKLHYSSPYQTPLTPPPDRS
jgi:hypothetical protein